MCGEILNYNAWRQRSMLITENDRVILFGSKSNVEGVLNDPKLASMKIVAICQESMLEEKVEVSGIDSVSMGELVRYDAIVVVADESLSGVNAGYFAAHGIKYTLSTDVTFGEEESVEEAPVEETVEEAVEEAVVEEETAEAEETEVEEEPVEEAEPEVAAEPCAPTYSDEQYEDIKTKFAEFYDTVLRSVRNTKAKDDAVYNINKELQKYKDDYFLQISKALVNDLIGFREDCKKSDSDMTEFGLSGDKLIGYFECTAEQINDLLSVHGVSEENGIYSYNGKVIYPTPEYPKATDNGNGDGYVSTEPELEAVDFGAVSTPEELYGALGKCVKNIETLLARDEAFVTTINGMFLASKKQQAVCDGVLIVPALVTVLQIRDYSATRRDALKTAEDDFFNDTATTEIYTYISNYVEKLLLNFGVTIRSEIDRTFDAKYHRVLKMTKITAEESDKEKTVARYCSDCYMYGDKVVYPAKVIIYKL